MLGYTEIESIIYEIQDRIKEEIILANRVGEEELNTVLFKYGFTKKEEDTSYYIDLNYAKILIVGNCLIQKRDIDKLCRELKIDPERLDFVSFDESTNYNYERLRYSTKYSDVIFGSTPHSGRGMNGDTSIINHLESNPEEYPHVIRAMDSNGLCLSRNSIKHALMETRIFKN